MSDPCSQCNKLVSFCSKVDSTFCPSCKRWLEEGFDYIPRPDTHPEECCALPLCKCQHTREDHGRSIKLSELNGLSENEIEEALQKLTVGPHKCYECGCDDWCETKKA